MSTEYRRGIPSTAHVEAATRLGLLWHREAHRPITKTKFALVNGVVESNYGYDIGVQSGTSRVNLHSNESSHSYRPIRPDSTPVDWEVLDQEVARVGQQGQPLIGRDADGSQFAINTNGSRSPLPAQPQGFRADLWRRIAPFYAGTGRTSLAGLEAPAGFGDQEIAARWTVYQELKPLYDLVDGAQGEAAMPRDVEAEWDRQSLGSAYNGETDDVWYLRRPNVPGYSALEAYAPPNAACHGRLYSQQGSTAYCIPLRNFAAVLDAVAEARVRARLGTVSPAQPGQQPIGRLIESTGDSPRTVAQPPALPEPRRFADVRPDRHGWRWWRQTGRDSTDLGQRFETLDGRCRWRSAHADAWFVPDTANPEMLRYTVIPTDEQGNPVSWEAAGFTAEAMRFAQETVQRAANDATPSRSVSDIIVDPATGMVRSAHTVRIESPTPPRPGPLPRFTTDELDDVDHSRTTKLDEVTLRRGKLPTVEQIAKYREVRARRTGGTVADALKESRIDCEVAQYVLERWAGGLGDADTVLLLRAAGCIVPLQDAPRHSIRAFDPKQGEVDRRSQDFLRTHNAALDASEKPSPTVQRERQEADERRQRLAELRQRLATERLAQPQEMAKENEAGYRFDLIEPDPQADPAASIRAWEASQAAAKARPVPAPPRIAKPVAAPRRPAIEVVDAEVDGLSRSEAFAALFGRALNGGC